MSILNAFGQYRYSPVEVLSDNVLADVLKPTFLNICNELRLTKESAEELMNTIWNSPHEHSILQFEHELQQSVRSLISSDALRSALERRAMREAQQVLPYVTGSTLADIGCGDGLVAWKLRECVQSIWLIDVCFYVDSRVELPYVQNHEGEALPVTKPFDTCLLLTVLHHAQDPVSLLQYTRRITRRRAVVIESIYGIHASDNPSPLLCLDYERQRKYATFLDWLYNRIFHDGVPVPYNFGTPSSWQKTFESTGWHVDAAIDLGVDQPIVPEHHFLFVLKPA
jgi:Methyltransferase domain.